MIEFKFSEQEKKMAIQEGKRRQQLNEIKNLKGRNGGPEVGKQALKMHILGAAGEMAVASYLNLKDHLFSNQEAERGSADLPNNIDVKTRSKHYYDLIVQKDEDLNKIYVLVTIENKQTFIHGWIHASDSMKEEYWSDPAKGRAAYFIPKNRLNPIEKLKDYLSLSLK